MSVACQDDAAQREIENQRDAKKKEAVFSAINESWNFNTRPVNQISQTMISQWEQWRLLLSELEQKPQSTIGAFRKKAESLAARSKELSSTVPPAFNKPEVRARIAVLTTKINSLHLFMSLQDIPDKKIVALIGEINTELTGIQFQLGEIVRRNSIPREEGESDMIRMLDTARAIPNTPVKNLP